MSDSSFASPTSISRRRWMRAAGAAVGGVVGASLTAGSTSGPPGPYRGRVVSVAHSAALSGTAVQASAVHQIFQMGMLRLTEASTLRDAWSQFVSPTDIVGVKFNSSNSPGYPLCSPVVLSEIAAGIASAGVPLSNIIFYDRYLSTIQDMGMDTWIPAGTRWAYASPSYDFIQHDMGGYDPAWFIDLPYVHEGQDVNDPVNRRSYVALFATQNVTKIINLAIMKDHEEAGVTLALKGMSYGMANNVDRGHPLETGAVHLDVFIPSIASLLPIRSKVVLNIIDGIRAVYACGPSTRTQYLWDHKTMYFSTDPVAVDRIGWRVIDQKRAAAGLPPADTAAPCERASTRQPQHILLAGAAGLGESDLSKIDLRTYQYGLMR